VWVLVGKVFAYYSLPATTNNAQNVRLFVLHIPNFTATNSETGNNPSWLNAGLLFICGGSSNPQNGLSKAYLRCILSDESGRLTIMLLIIRLGLLTLMGWKVKML